MDDLAAAKAELRARILAARKAMPADERATRSAALVARVLALPAWRTAAVALAYHPFGAEPDIRPLLAGPQPRVLLPRVEGQRLAFMPWAPGERLIPSPFGVPEPTGAPVDPSIATVALVPGLAFDAAGYRIGYGGGFYDRVLAGLAGVRSTGGLVAIGVCFAPHHLTTVPHGEGDVAVDVVVTDEG